jgi:uncharacterized protein YbaA (DUF1428 family)
MTYIDGFIVPVPNGGKDAYLAMARKAAPLFKEFGALRVVEAWGDDVPKGKHTDFFMAVKTTEEENVVFSWIEWPDKATRDAGMAKFMADPRMKMDEGTMPFDGKRVVFGGFDVMMET